MAPLAGRDARWDDPLCGLGLRDRSDRVGECERIPAHIRHGASGRPVTPQHFTSRTHTDCIAPASHRDPDAPARVLASSMVPDFAHADPNAPARVLAASTVSDFAHADPNAPA